MPDYNRAVKTAQKLIGAAGRTVTLITGSEVAVDPDALLGPTDDDFPGVDVKAAFVEPSSNSALGYAVQNINAFKDSTKICMVAADGVNDFEMFTKLVDDDGTYQINHVEVLRPGDVAILYFIGIKSP